MNAPKLERMEGPWWWSWLAVFGIGIPNGLDFHGEIVGLKREDRAVAFWESNASYRKRLTRKIREGLPPL